MDDYLVQIAKIIANKTGVDPEDIKEESYLEDDLNIGEMELVDIIGALEEEYAVEFTEVEKEKVESIMDLIELVVEKVE